MEVTEIAIPIEIQSKFNELKDLLHEFAHSMYEGETDSCVSRFEIGLVHEGEIKRVFVYNENDIMQMIVP